ncbi:phenylalanine--tRNA ligase subunit beta [Candidatus Woesearchaeota archaeon]|mgnify:CR=1 FL=1|jgi:phenylalanyl-tRNA synthetase beta chain|nr:phenylalanine--tRNA ligase subunit beta [Candidatus Woesearchaeota archaeon]MBT6044978.1 phenylalanine--tRNA ligase subunit beta [Candidatus Woesearchaeota archaeon]
MPKITLNKKDTLKLIGKNISDKQLSEAIPLMGTDLEHISKNEIEVEIFPNRPDMLSEEGFARAMSSFLGIKTGLKTYKVNKSNYKYKVDSKVKSVRPYCTAAVVKGLKFNKDSLLSLMNLQDKLHTTHGRNRKKVAMGVHDLSKIRFPLTYTTKPKSFKFRALEDRQEKTIQRILEEHPKGKDYAHLLNKKEVPIWIDAKDQVLSMPPIINSEETKVTIDTKDIFLDLTGTDPIAIDQALNILVTALVDRGGKIYSVNNTPNLNPKKIKININRLNKLLGTNLAKSQISKLASKMGLSYSQSNSTMLYPAYRADILSEVDITEDIAIAYGYNNFKTSLPNISTIAEEEPFERFKNQIGEICIGLNLQEVSSYHLSNKEDETTKMNTKVQTVKVINSISNEYNVLRPWIIPSLMNILKINRHNEYPQNLFEMGKVFIRKGINIEEPTRLGITLCNHNTDFTEARKVLDAIFSSLGLIPKYENTEHDSFIPGRVARVSINNKKVAYIGELHPEVIKNFNMDMPVAAIELNLSEIHKILN